MKMVSGPAVVTGGDFKQIQGDFIVHDNRQYASADDSATFGFLLQQTAPNALHNSGERRDAVTCHPNTRITIQERIRAWVESLDAQTLDRLIMWLHGPAGAGKSAIAQTMAELFYDEGILLAAFFFSRFDSTRNQSRSLISTIAYQVALSFPAVRANIISAINHDPHLFSKSLSTQMVLLLVEPLRPLISSGYFNNPKCRRVVIIDGLDECEKPKEQLAILATIADALRNHHLPLAFLIASRPEHELKSAFGNGNLKNLSTPLALNDDLQSNIDIELFLRDRFDGIKLTHPFKEHIPPKWPTDDAIMRLVRKSSGQFIYASTVVKFVELSRERPTVQLDIVLGLRLRGDATPFEELDALYRHILSSANNKELALRIMALSLLSQTPVEVWSLWPPHNAGVKLHPPIELSTYETLLNLASGDANIALCDLGSLLEIRSGGILYFFHASFEDFLLDKSRSGAFHIDPPTRNAETAHCYFRRFQKDFDGNDLLWFAIFLRDASPTPALLTNVVNISFKRFWEQCTRRGIWRKDYILFSCAFLTIIKNSKLPKWIFILNYFRFICTVEFLPKPEVKGFALASVRHSKHPLEILVQVNRDIESSPEDTGFSSLDGVCRSPLSDQKWSKIWEEFGI
ncbi:hypothetical protein GALMADRAFT_633733 [Galerina marginata CBS 339.88]|uniref:Nephrocystin 3-like N-terminal domain-containing protein n=1 Tax=Galerina marginata (strain CBS 339.88) TaxID=685588 RepID=A0A067SSE5_GALM3|nr:hypothetical protein GALMADRAFT_633733 [Galerina marginata CBS 339.88]